MRVVLVPGTFANTGRGKIQDAWWVPGSDFYKAAAQHGIVCLSFAWKTSLDGVFGANTGWEEAAEELYNKVRGLQPVNLYAHSHGGNVAIYAAALYELRIHILVTMATPRRADVPYDIARPFIQDWTHIYGGERDWTQLAGEFGDGRIGWHRDMPLANKNIECPECGHSETHDAATWDKYGIWQIK